MSQLVNYPSHSSYDESDINWLDKVPSHWESTRIKFVARLESGHTPSRNNSEYWDGGEIPWLSLKDLSKVREEGQKYITETEEKITQSGLKNSGARLLPEGTVFLSRTASVGICGILGVPAATTQDFANWICGPKIKPNFLYYVFRSMTEEFDRLSRGSTHQTIYMSDIERLSTPLPPVDEQNSIISYLEYHVSRIDSVIEKKKRFLELLEEKRSVLVEKSTIEGISDTRFNKCNELEVLDDRPADWDVRRAKTLFRERDDRGYDDLPLLEVSLNHGVRLREENEGRKAWEASDLETMKRVVPGDLVFNKMRLWQGAVDKSDHEGLVSPDYTVIEPKSEAYSPYYAYLLQTEAYKTEVYRRSYGIVDDRLRIYWTQFGDMPLLHPSPDEQEEIVQHINDSHQQLDDLRTKLQYSIDLLEEKREALITAAVTGQLDLSDWNLQKAKEPSP